MKSEFEMLNDVKIDIDNYEEVEFENNDEIKNRMKSKIKSNNSNYKKIITASSIYDDIEQDFPNGYHPTDYVLD